MLYVGSSRAMLARGVPKINVALAANGGVASASSSFSGAFPAAGLNNGQVTTGWGSGGGWSSAIGSPQWAQVDFDKPYKILRVQIHSYGSTSNTPESSTMSGSAIVAFTASAWDGAQWVELPGSPKNNAHSWYINNIRRLVVTSKMRVDVSVNGITGGDFARIHELQVFAK